MAKSLLSCLDSESRYIPASVSGFHLEDGFSEEEEEEEEDINALNDETFGRDILEDWESNHQELSSQYKDEGATKTNTQDDDDWCSVSHLEESITALVLDEEPLEDPAISYISRSKPVRVPNSKSIWRHSPVPQLHADASGSPQINSIWATSPSDSGIFPGNICDGLPSTASLPKNLPNARTLEDIERDILNGPSSSSNAAPSTPINLKQFSRPPPSTPPFSINTPPTGDYFGKNSVMSPPLTSPKDLLAYHLPNGFSYSPNGTHHLESMINRRRTSECEDEYAGLMSSAEKNWLVSIQLNQLHTDNPYVDDYYYMAFIAKKLAKDSETQPIREPERFSKLQNKKYTPPKIENTLGRLQFGSVQAPRKIIDADVTAFSKERDVSKQKQVLLEIEQVYMTLLHIDDCSRKLASLEEGPELEEVENESRGVLLKLHRQMADEDKLVQFLQVRKGKRLLTRIEPFLTAEDRQRVVISLLKSFGAISKKDVDDLLSTFAHLCEKAISEASLPQLINIVSRVTNSCLISVLGHKMGVYVIILLLHRAESLDVNNHKDWNEFIELVGSATNTCHKIPQSIKSISIQQTIKLHPNLIKLQQA